MNSYATFFFGLFLCLITVSCNPWEFKKIPSETYLAKKWRAIDLNDVDTFPSFDSCDELATKEVLRTCFENKVTGTLYKALSKHDFTVNTQLQDTINIGFIVNEKGLYCIDTLHISNQILSEIPLIELWIYDACEELPKAHPATLLNIPVQTKFTIPLVLQTSDL